jgi:hypothetical protein
MNPLQLTFVYYPEDDDEPIIITETSSHIIPRIGETVMLDIEDAESRGLITNAWEVIDVFYQLPKIGSTGTLTNVTVYIDPSEDEEDDEE